MGYPPGCAFCGSAENLKLNQANKQRIKHGSQELERAKSQLEVVERKIRNIIDAIADGLYNPTMKQTLTDLEGQQATLQATIEGLERRQSVELTEELRI